MTIELSMLAYTVALLFLLVLIQALAGVLAQGLPAMAGSRDQLGEPSRMQARTKRLVDNHREGLLLFAPLVLIASLTGTSTEWTVLGAQLFFYSRVVHAILYLTGVPWVRPVAWVAGIAGCILIFVALF
ncbi:MAG TPA: MAPEG family protein [Pseudomonadales bacterium]